MKKIPIQYVEENTSRSGIRIPIRIVRYARDSKRQLFLQRYAFWNYRKKIFLGLGIFCLTFVFGNNALAFEGSGINEDEIGYWCPPYTITTRPSDGSNVYWSSTMQTCTYYGEGAPAGAGYGDFYKGTIGNATRIAGHALGDDVNFSSTQNDDYTGFETGDPFFIAIFEYDAACRTYFASGTGSCPTNYGIYEFIYREGSIPTSTVDYDCNMVVPYDGAIIGNLPFYSASYTVNDTSTFWTPGIEIEYNNNNDTQDYENWGEHTWNSVGQQSNGEYTFLVNQSYVNAWFTSLGIDVPVSARAYIKIDGVKHYCPSSNPVSATMSNNSSTWTTSTMPNSAGPITISRKTVQQECQGAEDWTDIGGGIYYAACSTWNFLFTVEDVAFAPFQVASDKFKSLKPFSYFFTVKDKLSSRLDSAGASSTPTLALSLPLANSTFEYNILSSSTLSGVIGSEQKNNIFAVQEYIIYLFTLVGAYTIFRTMA